MVLVERESEVSLSDEDSLRFSSELTSVSPSPLTWLPRLSVGMFSPSSFSSLSASSFDRVRADAAESGSCPPAYAKRSQLETYHFKAWFHVACNQVIKILQ